MSNARRRFRWLSFAIFLFKPGASGQPSLFPALLKTEHICSSVGAATLTSRVRERIGAIIFEVLFASKINRRLGLYFSIVRLRAACASRVR